MIVADNRERYAIRHYPPRVPVMIEHLAALAFLLVITGFSGGAIWLNYRLHALEADRASSDVFDSIEERAAVDRGLVAPQV